MEEQHLVGTLSISFCIADHYPGGQLKWQTVCYSDICRIMMCVCIRIPDLTTPYYCAMLLYVAAEIRVCAFPLTSTTVLVCLMVATYQL